MPEFKLRAKLCRRIKMVISGVGLATNSPYSTTPSAKTPINKPTQQEPLPPSFIQLKESCQQSFFLKQILFNLWLVQLNRQRLNFLANRIDNIFKTKSLDQTHETK